VAFLLDRKVRALWRGFGLANGLSSAHSQPMGHILFKIADFLVAICVASVIAVTMWCVAYYVFGVSSLDIRRSALMGAAIFALLLATLWLQKKS